MTMLRVAVLLTVLAFATGAHAAGATACTASGVSGVSFGMYDPDSYSPLDTTGTLTVTCDGSATISISLSNGSAGTYASRLMRSGSNTMSYNLFLDPTRTIVWGDGTGTSSLFGPAQVTLSSPVTAFIYGRVFPRQKLKAGDYADTLTVTVIY